MTTRSCSPFSTSGPPSVWCDCSRAKPARASARSSSRPVVGRAARVSWLRRSPRRKRGVRSGSGPRNAPEERELRDSAEMFEAALGENPADLTILEAPREIYTRLGDVEGLMETVGRIERLDSGQGAPGSRRRAAAAAPEPAPAAPAAPFVAPVAPPPAPAPPAPIIAAPSAPTIAVPSAPTIAAPPLPPPHMR